MARLKLSPTQWSNLGILARQRDFATSLGYSEFHYLPISQGDALVARGLAILHMNGHTPEFRITEAGLDLLREQP